MIRRCKLLGITLVLSTLAATSHAAISRETISVVFRNAEPGSVSIRRTEPLVPGAVITRGTGTQTLRYHFMFGDDLWQSSRRLHRCSDADIAESIDMASHMQWPVRIALEVPGQTTLSTVAAAIERLKNLAAANAVEGCKVEIIVFPSARRAAEPEPSAAQ